MLNFTFYLTYHVLLNYCGRLELFRIKSRRFSAIFTSATINGQLLTVYCWLLPIFLSCWLSPVDCLLSIVYCLLFTVCCQLQTVNCLLYTVNRLYYWIILSTVNCQLLTVNCLLSTVYCLLSTVLCILCIVHCLLSLFVFHHDLCFILPWRKWICSSNGLNWRTQHSCSRDKLHVLHNEMKPKSI